MLLFEYFKSISAVMLQIFFLGLIGFLMVRKNLLSKEGLTGLTNLLIEVVFPALIFWQIAAKFSFSLYPDWWLFSLMSVAITLFGLLIGYLTGGTPGDGQVKKEFVSLTAFQNSGYLPLTLLGWVVTKGQLGDALIYLFLFLLGFNLVFWSWGAYFLSSRKSKYFSFSSLFNAPVIATLLGFACVATRLNTVIPKFIMSPLEVLGNCSFPLAIIVVGASLAELNVAKKFDARLVTRLVLVKLILLPLFGLLLVAYIRLPYLIGLLLVLELAVPSATSLAVVVRKYGQQETIISQGIFVTHLVSLITLPVVLAFFNWIVFKP